MQPISESGQNRQITEKDVDGSGVQIPTFFIFLITFFHFFIPVSNKNTPVVMDNGVLFAYSGSFRTVAPVFTKCTNN